MTQEFKIGNVVRFAGTKTKYMVVRVLPKERIFWAIKLGKNAWQPIHIKVKALSLDLPENATYKVTNVDNGKSVEKKGLSILKTTQTDKKLFTEAKRHYTAMRPLRSWTHTDVKRSARVRRAVGGTVNYNAIHAMPYGKGKSFDPEFVKSIGIKPGLSKNLKGKGKTMVGAVPNHNYLDSMTGIERRKFRY